MHHHTIRDYMCCLETIGAPQSIAPPRGRFSYLPKLRNVILDTLISMKHVTEPFVTVSLCLPITVVFACILTRKRLGVSREHGRGATLGLLEGRLGYCFILAVAPLSDVSMVTTRTQIGLYEVVKYVVLIRPYVGVYVYPSVYIYFFQFVFTQGLLLVLNLIRVRLSHLTSI